MYSQAPTSQNNAEPPNKKPRVEGTLLIRLDSCTSLIANENRTVKHTTGKDGEQRSNGKHNIFLSKGSEEERNVYYLLRTIRC